MKVLAATNNAHKLKELRAILAPLGYEIVSPRKMNIALDPEETGETFEENAQIKADAFAAIAKIPVIADDSGLETDYLHGAPGVLSARYAPGSDRDRIDRLLLDMKDAQERTARFVSVVAMVFPDGKRLVARGECEGVILCEPQGENGFGYDPVFYVEEFQKTFAQLAPEEKNAISHRGRALQKLKILLDKQEEHMFTSNHETKSDHLQPGASRKILSYSGGLMMVEVTAEADTMLPVHSHPHEQISYIAKGSFEIFNDGKTYIARTGDSVYFAPETPHGVKALEDAVIVDVFTPIREDFLQD